MSKFTKRANRHGGTDPNFRKDLILKIFRLLLATFVGWNSNFAHLDYLY